VILRGAELPLGPVPAAEDDFWRLIEVIPAQVGTPALFVGSQPRRPPIRRIEA
jgi:hypothetical protein